MSTAAIVLAGGAGTRLQHPENKVYLPVAGRSLLAWSLRAFQASSLIDAVVLVIRGGDAERARAVLAATPTAKLLAVVDGGATRHESEHAGLEALATAIEAGRIDLVCVHDAARPFISQELLAEVLTTARDSGGALPGLPVGHDHLLRIDEDGHPVPVETSDLRRVQTPQAFLARPLLEAHRAAAHAGFQGVDTAEAVERFSELSVRVVVGDPRNVKVTVIEDLGVVEQLAADWERDQFGEGQTAERISR